MEVTLTLTTPAARVATAGTKAIAEFRANGGGSNRSQWARMEAVLIACMTVVATGTGVELPSGAGLWIRMSGGTEAPTPRRWARVHSTRPGVA